MKQWAILSGCGHCFVAFNALLLLVGDLTGQLSLLPSAGWKMSTGQSAVISCGWGVKARWLIPFLDKHVGSR